MTSLGCNSYDKVIMTSLGCKSYDKVIMTSLGMYQQPDIMSYNKKSMTFQVSM